MANARTIKNDVSIVLCGAAGQGIQTIEQVLTHALKLSGYNVFATKEVMSRIRGGCNSTEIRVSGRPVRAFVERIDILVPLNEQAFTHLAGRISEDTIVVGSAGNAENSKLVCEIDFEKVAEDAGNKLYANSVAVGAICGILGSDRSALDGYLKKVFESKGEDAVSGNLTAAGNGYESGRGFAESGAVTVDMESNTAVAGDVFLNGAAAVGLGGLAGGCDFVSSYPMSPSTGVLVFFAQHAHDFGTVVEQAEDEIAAINMCLGAWYAGGRAMATTSGGGFALMCEGMSLAGMTESPLVVHLAQRPGPATGLPTRTEQGDLNLALYAGHGEYPRIILAPGGLEDAFELSAKAFDLADRYQVPVLILTDQFLMDSYWNLESLPLDDINVNKRFVETGKDYKRYDLSSGAVSPRGIPGLGGGLVCVDSDEHDEEGHITEDLEIRNRMMEKRLAKLDDMDVGDWSYSLEGREDADLLVVCWGSSYNAVAEALTAVGNDNVACLHVRQVYPLPAAVVEAVKNAGSIVVVENNATGQFAALLKLVTGRMADQALLKYNGMPFSVEELTESIRDLIT